MLGCRDLDPDIGPQHLPVDLGNTLSLTSLICQMWLLVAPASKGSRQNPGRSRLSRHWSGAGHQMNATQVSNSAWWIVTATQVLVKLNEQLSVSHSPAEQTSLAHYVEDIVIRAWGMKTCRSKHVEDSTGFHVDRGMEITRT